MMKFIGVQRLTTFTILVGILFLTATLVIGSSQNKCNPPEITFDIDFPSQIRADGEQIQSFIFFKALDKDIAQINFKMTTHQVKKLLTLDPHVKGKLSGVIKFTIAATSPPLELQICVGEGDRCKKIRVSDTAPAEVTLSVTLADEAGNESEPREFSFKIEAIEKPNQPPVARFIYSPTEPKVGEEVTFDASDSSDPDGKITSYEWDFGDGRTGSGKTVRHAYSTEGRYQVQLSVTDDDGGTDSVTKIVAIKAISLVSAWIDDFNSPSLSSRWSWIREDSSHWSLTEHPGFLRIRTQKGGLLFDSNNAKNLLVQNAPIGDFEIQTHVIFTPTENFQMAGLLVYQDDDNFLVLGRAYCGAAQQSCVGNGIYFDYEERSHWSHFVIGTMALGEAYLRLVKAGNLYIGYFSENGVDWTVVGTHKVNKLTPSKIGLAAYDSNTGATETSADFDYFRLSND